MTIKERKIYLRKKIKEISKSYGWKYKEYFSHKVIGNLFFESTFYISRKENKIHGVLSFKPYEIDDLFWIIIDERGNINNPQSFRGEAAFCVRPYKIFRYEIGIPDLRNPETEIAKLIKSINEQVQLYLLKTQSINDYLNLIKDDEKEYSVGVVTCLILDKKFELAIQKIKEYRKIEIPSGFRFGIKDYFDLAEYFIIDAKNFLKDNTS